MTRLIIGLVGRKGSGKGTVAKILKEKYGASVYRFSDVLSDILNILFVENSHENLIRLSEILRPAFGQDILKKALLQRMKNDAAPLIVLDGLRRLEDLNGLESAGEFLLVNVTAPPETRFARMQTRGEKAGETSKTLESFMELEQAPTEVTIASLEARANRTIDNSGTADDLEQKVKEMMIVLSPPYVMPEADQP